MSEEGTWYGLIPPRENKATPLGEGDYSWCTPVTPAPWEAETEGGRFKGQGQSGQFSKTLSQNKI